MRSNFKTFNSLTNIEVYKVLQLRSEVFVVEQNCVYQDIDNADIYAIHQMIWKNDQLMAYARILPPGTYFDDLSIGRILTAKSVRGQKLGHLLIREGIDYCHNYYPHKPIKLSAQQYLIKFYQSHGFATIGKGYLEDGIPHIVMIRNQK